MNNRNKLKLIEEANQRLEKSFLKSKGLLKEYTEGPHNYFPNDPKKVTKGDIKLFEQYLNELKLYTNYGDYNTEDNIQKLKDMNIKFPTEEEFVGLVKSNCIDNGKISADGIKKVEEEIRKKYGKDFTCSFSDPLSFSKWLGRSTGNQFSLTYNPFCEESAYLGCIYVYEVK